MFLIEFVVMFLIVAIVFTAFSSLKKPYTKVKTQVKINSEVRNIFSFDEFVVDYYIVYVNKKVIVLGRYDVELAENFISFLGVFKPRDESTIIMALFGGSRTGQIGRVKAITFSKIIVNAVSLDNIKSINSNALKNFKGLGGG